MLCVPPISRTAPLLALWLAIAACGGDDEEPAWQVVFEDLDGALMSVWASAPDEVWAVGADDGEGSLVLRYDGQAWTRLATGTSGDLWWVFGFEGGPVFAGGDGGQILRYDGASETFESMTTPEMWAVGGSSGGADGAFAWPAESRFCPGSVPDVRIRDPGRAVV